MFFFFLNFIKNPQTTIALTFLTHIISSIDGVYFLASSPFKKKELWLLCEGYSIFGFGFYMLMWNQFRYVIFECLSTYHVLLLSERNNPAYNWSVVKMLDTESLHHRLDQMIASSKELKSSLCDLCEDFSILLDRVNSFDDKEIWLISYYMPELVFEKCSILEKAGIL